MPKNGFKKFYNLTSLIVIKRRTFHSINAKQELIDIHFYANSLQFLYNFFHV